MPTFIKKPVPIEATRWFKNGDHPNDEVDRSGDATESEGKVVRRFRDPTTSGRDLCKHCSVAMFSHGWIDTLEGGHIVCPGDFIITGVKGERYPCKPDIFLDTYDPGEPDSAAIIAILLSELGRARSFCVDCSELLSEEVNPREHAVDLKHRVAMVAPEVVVDPPEQPLGRYYATYNNHPATGRPLAYFAVDYQKCPRCGSEEFYSEIAADGSCYQRDHCTACNFQWFNDPPKPVTSIPKTMRRRNEAS